MSEGVWAGTAVVGPGLRGGMGPTGILAWADSRMSVPGSRNQWSFGNVRVYRPCPSAVELETPSPELWDAQEEKSGL